MVEKSLFYIKKSFTSLLLSFIKYLREFVIGRQSFKNLYDPWNLDKSDCNLRILMKK